MSDVQIIDLVWIDPAARGLANSGAANVTNLLADADLSYVLVNADSDFIPILAAVDSAKVRVVAIPRPARLLWREFHVLRLAAGAVLFGHRVYYTSWLPRLCACVLLLPIACRLVVHDLNSFRPRIYDAKFRRPSLLSRLHQWLSIKRATVVQCFARSVARQLKLLRADGATVISQTVTVVRPAEIQKRPGSAVIFLDERDCKGTWVLDRFWCSGKAFQLTVIGKIDPLHETRLRARGIAVRSVRPSEAEKCQLLADAEFLIFCSKYEGFGLPVREAAAFGTPSLIARRAALLDVPPALSLSIDAFGDRVDLAEVARRAAVIDPGALKRWAEGFLGPVSTAWSPQSAGRAAPRRATASRSRLSQRGA